MATPPASNNKPISNHKKTPSSSSSTKITCSLLKQVFLHDWWLIQSDICPSGKQLGIGGFNSRERQGLRVFHSAPIVKRHDTVTLETLDGITVTVAGFINRSRTLKNGFPSEICSHFLFGFPYYWEEFSAVATGEESADGVVRRWTESLDQSKVSSAEKLNGSLPVSFEDLPATAIHDLLMSTLRDSERSMLTGIIFDNIPKNYGGNTCCEIETSDCLNEHGSLGMVRDTTPRKHQSKDKTTKAEQKQKSDYAVSDATPSRKKKGKKEQKKKSDNATSGASASDNKKRKVQEKHKGDDAASDASAIKSEMTKPAQKKNGDIIDHVSEATPWKYKKSKVKQRDKADHATSPVAHRTDSIGRLTRSMTGLKNLRNRQEENLSRSTSVTSGFKESVSASEAPGKRSQGLGCGRKVSKIIPTSTFLEEIEGVKESPKGPALRRSGRLQSIQNA